MGLSCRFGRDVLVLFIRVMACMCPISVVMKHPSGRSIKLKIARVNLLEISRSLSSQF